MATSQLLNDANIEHQIALIRYSQGRANTIIAPLRSIVDYIESRLAKEGETIATKKALNALLDDVNRKLNTIYTSWENDEFTPTFRVVTKNELEFQTESIDAVAQDYTPVTPTQKASLSRARNTPLLIGAKGGAVDFNDYTKGWKPTEIKRVSDRIVSGFYSGETTTQIARAVNGLKSQRYADGILNISRANIQGMVKNTINHISAETKAEFAKDNDDLIIGMRDIATLDSKTSQECRFRDGNVYLFSEYGQNYPKPPYHHGGCRTTQSPELNPEYQFLTESRTRPAVTEEDGKAVAEQVSGNTTYYQWLKRQPAPVQNEALGPTQGKVFRNAGLTPDEFRRASVNRFGEPISLEQMAANNDRIANYLSKQG